MKRMRHAGAALLLLLLCCAAPAAAQVTTRTVADTVRRASAQAWAGATVTFKLDKSTYTAAGTFPADTVTATANSSGVFSVALWCNAEGTVKSLYTATYPDGSTFQFRLAYGDGSPVPVPVLRAAGITPAPAGDPAYVTMQDLVSAHAAAADPHAGYQTQPEGDARYYTQTQLDLFLAAKAAAVHSHAIADTTGLQAALDSKAAVSYVDSNDATLLTAIGQRATTAYVDAADASLVAAIGTKADSSHNHTLANITDEGTAAALNVAASGDAASGEVVKGSDSRLTNARTPTSHTHPLSEVTGDGALAAKNTVATADIDDDAVTFPRLQNIATNKLLGRSTAGSGDVEEISVGSGLSLAGGTLSASGGGDVVANATRTDNRLTKWTDATNKVVGNSLLSDDGTNVTISTGALRAPNGFTSAPSYSFTNETNTGMTLTSANILGFYVAGVRGMDLRANSAFFLAGSDAAAITLGTAGDMAVTRGAAHAFSFGGSTLGETFRALPLSPAQITADQNNYNPGGSSLYQRWNTNASRNITGMTFTAAQVTGQTHVIINVGSNNIVLVHESASSTAANRFLSSTGADITLSANQAADVWYDGTSARWRVFKRN